MHAGEQNNEHRAHPLLPKSPSIRVPNRTRFATIENTTEDLFPQFSHQNQIVVVELNKIKYFSPKQRNFNGVDPEKGFMVFYHHNK